jgi:uncharacterized protein (DUF1697 family)
MTRYVALLRGVNVGGKPVRMELLRASFEALGCKGVRTYIQSGNVVFDAGAKNAATLVRKIEAKLREDFNFAVATVLLSAEELRALSERNPFASDKTVDQGRLHVTFLPAGAPAAAAQILESLAGKAERYHIGAREIFLYCPNGYGTSKLANPFIEKKLGVTATTRNWKTVQTLVTMASAD